MAGKISMWAGSFDRTFFFKKLLKIFQNENILKEGI